MFEFLKKKKTEPVQVASELSARLGDNPKRNKLRVYLQNGDVIAWWIDDWKGEVIIQPWIRFYKWYFGRKSDSFVMRWKAGETMIRRDDIKRFDVTITDVA